MGRDMVEMGMMRERGETAKVLKRFLSAYEGHMRRLRSACQSIAEGRINR